MDDLSLSSFMELNPDRLDEAGVADGAPDLDRDLALSGMLPAPSPLKYLFLNDSLFDEGYDSEGYLGVFVDEASDEENELPSGESANLAAETSGPQAVISVMLILRT